MTGGTNDNTVQGQVSIQQKFTSPLPFLNHSAFALLTVTPAAHETEPASSERRESLLVGKDLKHSPVAIKKRARGGVNSSLTTQLRTGCLCKKNRRLNLITTLSEIETKAPKLLNK